MTLFYNSCGQDGKDGEGRELEEEKGRRLDGMLECRAIADR